MTELISVIEKQHGIGNRRVIANLKPKGRLAHILIRVQSQEYIYNPDSSL